MTECRWTSIAQSGAARESPSILKCGPVHEQPSERQQQRGDRATRKKNEDVHTCSLSSAWFSDCANWCCSSIRRSSARRDHRVRRPSLIGRGIPSWARSAQPLDGRTTSRETTAPASTTDHFPFSSSISMSELQSRARPQRSCLRLHRDPAAHRTGARMGALWRAMRMEYLAFLGSMWCFDPYQAQTLWRSRGAAATYCSPCCGTGPSTTRSPPRLLDRNIGVAPALKAADSR